MKRTPPNFTTLNETAFIDVGHLTEDQARAILEGIRWPNGIVCPHCGGLRCVRIQAHSEKVRDDVIRCNDCRKQFTVTVGTVMQGSHITLSHWALAFYSMCSHKKGVSALQLQRNLGLHTYRAARHLAHRIRYAMREEPLAQKLRGTVEVDETYVNGKPRKGHDSERRYGRGTQKPPVLALVERDGRVRSKPVEHVDAATLQSAIREQVHESSTIMTDEWPAYQGIGIHYARGHKTVQHGAGEYVLGDAYTNDAESLFALLKRGVHRIFHHISKMHLHRYCDEFSFRWDNRKTSDGERATQAIKGADGKRLVYKLMVNKQPALA